MTQPAHQFGTQIISPVLAENLFAPENRVTGTIAGWTTGAGLSTSAWEDQVGSLNLVNSDRSSLTYDSVTVAAGTYDALTHNGSSQNSQADLAITPGVGYFLEAIFRVTSDFPLFAGLFLENLELGDNRQFSLRNTVGGQIGFTRRNASISLVDSTSLISDPVSTGDVYHVLVQATSAVACKYITNGVIGTASQTNSYSPDNLGVVSVGALVQSGIKVYGEASVVSFGYGYSATVLTDDQMYARWDLMHNLLVDLRGGQNLRSVKSFSAPTVGDVASIQLDGSSEAIHGRSQSLQDEFTVQFLVYGSDAPASEEVLLKQGFFEVLRQTDNTIHVDENSVPTTLINGTINLDKAVNVITIKQTAGGDLSLFIGNQQDGSAVSASLTMPDEPPQLGDTSGGTTDRVALSKIWDEALSDDEIAALAVEAIVTEKNWHPDFDPSELPYA